jgi:hypothetical protein
MKTINAIAQRVKVHPGIAGADVTNLSDDYFVFAVAQQIPSALKELTDQCMADRHMRQYVLSDPSVVTVNLDANGKGDLQPVVIDHGILIDSLHLGEIRHPAYADPLTSLPHSEGSMASNYSLMHGRYWLEGTVLHTRGTNTLTGPVGLHVPRALTLNNLHGDLTDNLVDLVVLRLRGGPVPPPSEQPK